MIETWFKHAYPGTYMRVTIFWAWVVFLLWTPIAMVLVGATEAWQFFQGQLNDFYRIQCRYWKEKYD